MPQEYDYRGNATWWVMVDTFENGRCQSYERPHIHCTKGEVEYRLRIDGAYCGDFIGSEAYGRDRSDLQSIACKYKVYCSNLYLDLYEELEEDENFSYNFAKKLTLKKEI